MEVLERKQIRIYKEHLPNELPYSREAMRQKLEDLSRLYFLVEREKNAKFYLAKIEENEQLKRLALLTNIAVEKMAQLLPNLGCRTDLLDAITPKKSTLRQLSAEVIKTFSDMNVIPQ